MRPPRHHQPAMGGRSTRHDRRWFGRLEQEDQRLNKHYGHWMDIVRSLELESFILTKLTKPTIPVNLVGPQVSLPLRWVPASRGSIHFFVRNKEALPCVRRYSWWVRPVSGGGLFSQNIEALLVVPTVRWRNHYFPRNKEALPCCGHGPSCQPLHVQYSFKWKSFINHIDHAAPRAPWRQTTARPRKGITRSRGRCGSGCPRGEEYEGSLVRLQCEPVVAAGPSQWWE